MRGIRWYAAAFLTLIVGSQRSMQAQSPPHRISTITVALVDQLPSGFQQYQAVILRRTQVPRDVILLPKATATPLLLDGATRTLLLTRSRQGDQPTTYKGRAFQALTIGVRTPAAAPAAWTQRYGSRLQVVINALERAPKKDIPGVGLVQAVTFYPPKT